MATISISSKDGKVVFDPPEITLDATTDDWVTWANLDEHGEHQPTLSGKPADYWLNDPLPPFVQGQPAATSPPIILKGTTSITYVDGLHPDDGSGTIHFYVPPAT